MAGNNQCDSDLRRMMRNGRKAGWEFVLNHENHFLVVSPDGKAVTTIAPRNRHWKVRAINALRPAGFPGI